MQKFQKNKSKVQEQREPPVHEGDVLDVQIVGMGEKGDGFFKMNGFVVFVPKVQVGDSISVKVTKVMRNLAFAEKVEQ